MRLFARIASLCTGAMIAAVLMWMFVTPKKDYPRIVFFGDSLTAGYRLWKSQSYPSLIEKQLEQLDYKYAVENLGVSGDYTSNGLERIQEFDTKNLAVFAVALGTNDWYNGLPASVPYQNLTSILSSVRSRNPTTSLYIFGSMPPESYPAAYREQYRVMFERVAKEFDAMLLPSLLAGIDREQGTVLDDGWHPNEHGQLKIAQQVWQLISPALKCGQSDCTGLRPALVRQ